MSATTKETTKVRVMHDVRVEAEFELHWTDLYVFSPERRLKTTSEVAEVMEQRIREFEEFMRDHRSQDMVRLHVARQYRDECAACHEAWDGDDEMCFNCGAKVSA